MRNSSGQWQRRRVLKYVQECGHSKYCDCQPARLPGTPSRTTPQKTGSCTSPVFFSIRHEVLANHNREDYENGNVGKTVHSRSGENLPPHRPRRIFDRNKVVIVLLELLSSLKWGAAEMAVQPRMSRPLHSAVRLQDIAPTAKGLF